jgi:hypothetical protein
MSVDLDALVSELESVAQRLRSERLESAEAAALVERCAELAGRIGAGLDAASRSVGEAEGQGRLL